MAFGLFLACSSASRLAPIADPDPAQPCPAGRTGWRIEVADQRADRTSTEEVVSLVTESIRKSFPGCRWDAEAGGSAGLIRIEVHRFTSRQDGRIWDAAASWTVLAAESGGRTLTEFEVDEEVSRPNYRGYNNAREALQEAFSRAIKRTIAGLRVVSSAAEMCPPRRTQRRGVAARRIDCDERSSSISVLCLSAQRARGPAGLERFSHLLRLEAL